MSKDMAPKNISDESSEIFREAVPYCGATICVCVSVCVEVISITCGRCAMSISWVMAAAGKMGLYAGKSDAEAGCSLTFITWNRNQSAQPQTQCKTAKTIRRRFTHRQRSPKVRISSSPLRCFELASVRRNSASMSAGCPAQINSQRL